MNPDVGRLFDIPSTKLPEELIEALVVSGGVRIERIVSSGQATPKGEWYDQQHAEWVLVLRGSAALRFESENEPVRLEPGDYVNIPPHCRHRVEWTDPEKPTIWLAIHYTL